MNQVAVFSLPAKTCLDGKDFLGYRTAIHTAPGKFGTHAAA